MKRKISYEPELPVHGVIQRPSGSKEPLHWHDSLEIGLCRKGSGQFFFSKKHFPIAAGDLFVVNHLEPHIARSDPGQPCELVFLNFDASILIREDEQLLLPFAYNSPSFSNRIPAGSHRALELGRLVETVFSELTLHEPGYRSAVRSGIVLICGQLLRLYQAGMKGDPWFRASPDFERKREVLQFMERHFAEPLELADLAEHWGLSRSGASRLFLNTVGQSFLDHLNELRVRDAKRRLLSTEDSITEICFASGFQSLPSFYRVFHRLTGQAPQLFRQATPLATVFELASS